MTHRSFLLLMSTWRRPAVTHFPRSVELHESRQKAREMHHYLIPLTPPLPLGRQRQGESSRQVAGRQLDPSRAAVPWKGTTGRRWSQTGPDVIFPASPQGAAARTDFLMRRGRGLLSCSWHIGTSSFSVFVMVFFLLVVFSVYFKCILREMTFKLV